MDATLARELLGVDLGASAPEINAAFRVRVVALEDARPDLMAALANARTVLLEELKSASDAVDLDPSDTIEVLSVPGSSTPISLERASALRDFRDRTVVHEDAGAPLPGALISWAALAAVATIVWGAIAIPLRPQGHWSQILYIFGGQAAWIAEQSQRAAGVFIICGAVLFAASFGLLGVRQVRGRYMAAAHIGVSSLVALPGTLVVLILTLNGLGIVLLGACAIGLVYIVFLMLISNL